MPALLPHQVHRAAKTVRKTEAHIARVRAAQKREKDKAMDSARNPRFHYESKKFIKERLDRGLGCEACGSRVGLQTHHVVPFHTDHALEMDKTNWIVLCMHVGGLECHEAIGHSKRGFKWCNPNSRKDAAELMAHPDHLNEIHARAIENAIPNDPQSR